MIPPRSGELTGNMNRDRFDDLPGDADPSQANRWSEFRAKYHAAQQLTSLQPFPLQLDFELNSTCQLKCAFCVHGQEIVPKRLMPFELYQRVIDEASEHGLCSIKLNYINEPLLRRDLGRFVRYAKQRGVLNVYFATNGILLTEERIRELIDSGVNKVMVSLDAATAETYRVMRRSDKFDAIIRNIHTVFALRQELGVSWPLVRVNFLRSHLNAHEAEQFVEQWTGVADIIGFQRQVALPGVDDDLFASEQEPVEDFRCSFPWKLLVIDVDGRILPCCTFSGRNLSIGNASDMTIEAAWKSLQHRALQRLHETGNGLQNPVCAHCIRGCQ